MYPQNDNQYEDTIIKSVAEPQNGWYQFEREDGWSFQVENPPIIPKVGMKVRMYGKGIGYSVRGLFIEGVECYYRTQEQEDIHIDEELYGKDIKEWLNRWDSGNVVWSISMGGFGPGYEQAIQITTAEIIRHCVEEQYDASVWRDVDSTRWVQDREKIREASYKNETIYKLGLSGAQFGAAMNLATMLYMNGPISVMKDEVVKDRHIQVSKYFPSV